MTESEYLQHKPFRTIVETVRLLRLRMEADDTKPEAKLMIVYEEAGAFRRVLARGLTGSDIGKIVTCVERETEDQPEKNA